MSEHIGTALYDQLMGSSATDTALGSDELTALVDSGLLDVGGASGLSAEEAALPEAIAMAPETGGGSLVAATTVAIGALYMTLSGGPAIESSSVGSATGVWLASDDSGGTILPCANQEFDGFGEGGQSGPPDGDVPTSDWWDGNGGQLGDDGSCDGLPEAPDYGGGLTSAAPDYMVVWEPWGQGTYATESNPNDCSDPNLAYSGDGVQLVDGGAVPSVHYDQVPSWLNGCEYDDTPGEQNLPTVYSDVVAGSSFGLGALQVGSGPSGVAVSHPAGLWAPQTVPAAATVSAGVTSYMAASQLDGGTALATLVLNYVTTQTALVPNCDGLPGDSSQVDYYPESYEACAAQLAAVGLDVMWIDASNPLCEDNNICWATGAAGQVDFVSSTEDTLTEATDSSFPVGTLLFGFVYELDGSGGGGTVTMPNCSGVTVPACETTLQEAGIDGTETINWQDGTATSTPAGYVVTTSPYEGAVVTNPATAAVVIDGAGIVLPAPTSSDELQTQYQSDLNDAGFSTVTFTVLDPSDLDPFAGPGAIITVSPAPGTVYDPSSPPAVGVFVNPNPMPSGGSNPGGGTGGAPAPWDPFSGPTTDPDGIYFPTIPTPCNVFPFGIPCWLVGALNQFNASPVAPTFSFPAGPYGTVTVDTGSIFGVETSTIMAYARPVLLFLTFAGFLLWLAHRPPDGFSTNDPGEQGELF